MQLSLPSTVCAPRPKECHRLALNWKISCYIEKWQCFACPPFWVTAPMKWGSGAKASRAEWQCSVYISDITIIWCVVNLLKKKTSSSPIYRNNIVLFFVATLQSKRGKNYQLSPATLQIIIINSLVYFIPDLFSVYLLYMRIYIHI